MKLVYLLESRIPERLRELVINRIEQAGFEWRQLLYSDSISRQREALSWADAVLCAPGRNLDADVMRSANHLLMYQLWSSGYDKFNCSLARACGVPVANNGGSNGTSVAEHTIMLMLAVSRQLPAMHDRTVTGNWSGNNHGTDLFMLSGKTLGIIGLGNIGTKVAKRALAFGMRVIYSDAVDKKLSGHGLRELERVTKTELVSESDIISLHLHLTDETKGLISRAEFDKMKATTILINVSRAGLVDQDAFRRALDERIIWGAGLDVYPTEPTEKGDPILSHPRVVATPHTAGSTIDILKQAIDESVANLERVANGEKPLFIIN